MKKGIKKGEKTKELNQLQDFEVRASSDKQVFGGEPKRKTKVIVSGGG